MADEKDIINRCNIFLERNDWNTLYSAATEGISNFPNNDIFYYLRAIAFGNSGDFDNAFSDAQIAINLKPNDKDYKNLLKDLEAAQDKQLKDIKDYAKQSLNDALRKRGLHDLLDD